MSPRKVPREEAYFRGYGLQVVMGSRYLGDFVGTETVQARCLEDTVEGWQYSVATLAGVARQNPQTAYNR